MKTFASYFFLLIFSVAFLSCAEEREMELDIKIESDTVEFEDLKIGDIMLYSYVTGKDYPNQSSEATYTGDTLQLTVVMEIDGIFVIEEQITPYSAIFESDTKYIYGDIEKIHKLLWDIREDFIIISTLESDGIFESHIFQRDRRFYFENDTDIIVDFNGCRTTLPYNNYLADFYIENGELLDITYPYLTGMLDYTPMVGDGDGSTHIYNKENGFVRVTSTSGWTAKVRGWDRIN